MVPCGGHFKLIEQEVVVPLVVVVGFVAAGSHTLFSSVGRGGEDASEVGTPPSTPLAGTGPTSTSSSRMSVSIFSSWHRLGLVKHVSSPGDDLEIPDSDLV
ncbi:hypothetical protein CRUP_000203 [Coryphaenoides rupestris]|nr:hypothetical protein CRUP_000203 [Coryphaenoides rupestris]